MSKILFASVSLAMMAMPASAAVVVTYENAGVQNTTATFDFVGVETFEGASTGDGQTFATTFGGSAISGIYTDLRVDSANQYGSAGGVGNHAVAGIDSAGYELTVSTGRPEGITYFGYWLSALDSGNVLEFYKGSSIIYTFTPGDVIGSLGGCPNAYCGNPTAPYSGQNSGEPYAFVNVFFTGGDTYDRIRFFESPANGNYESDNHTVGYFKEITGITVPEPATWAMLISGFGMVGFAARRRRALSAA